jgi:hypothetical protein
MSYLSTKYLLYLLRWIVSGFVMYLAYPLMNKFGIKNELLKLIISSIFGSIIFYQIDNLIFS